MTAEVIEQAIMPPGYRALGLLHRGNPADVYDAWSEERGSRCVVKTLRTDRPTDRRDLTQLLVEGRLLRRLGHPHLVRAYEVLSDPVPAVVLETLPGQTLGCQFDERYRLPVADTLHLGLHLCSAIGYLHRRGWLHLDLKPSNVIADAGRAKIIDLSIARRPGWCPAGEGTRGYRSPEQWRGGQVGPAADAWGIGLLLFEALSGREGYPEPAGEQDSAGSPTEPTGPAKNRADTGADSNPLLVGPPPPLRTLRRLPAALTRLVDSCLRLDPAGRPDVPALAAGLSALLDPATAR